MFSITFSFLSVCLVVGTYCAKNAPNTIIPSTPELKEEATIKLAIANVANLSQEYSSPFVTIGNLPWRLTIKPEISERTASVKHFGVFIECNPDSESTLWSVKATIEVTLQSQLVGVLPYVKKFSQEFNYNNNSWGLVDFMRWDDIVNAKKGYINNDIVILDAHITITNARGVRLHPHHDFTHADQCSDTTLLIGCDKVHVSKTYLSLHSPVFSTMFASKHGGKETTGSNVYRLDNVNLEEFTELLNIIYPSRKPVTAENVEFILKLSKQFDMTYVVDECEQFLIDSNEISTCKKFQLADQYSLSGLHDVLLKSFKSPEEVNELLESNPNLSDTAKVSLYQKLTALQGGNNNTDNNEKPVAIQKQQNLPMETKAETKKAT